VAPGAAEPVAPAAAPLLDGGAARTDAPGVLSGVAALLGRASGGAPAAAVTHLGDEDAGGPLDREAAVAAAILLEEGAWPPLPAATPSDLSWAARRVTSSFEADSDSGLAARNAAVAAPLVAVGGAGAAGAAAGRVATVPKALVNAELLGSGASPLNAPRASRAAALEASEAAIEAAEKAVARAQGRAEDGEERGPLDPDVAAAEAAGAPW
jgi:hypothetical protein